MIAGARLGYLRWSGALGVVAIPDWLFEQVEDRVVGDVPKWLRQSFKLVSGSVREAKDPVTH